MDEYGSCPAKRLRLDESLDGLPATHHRPISVSVAAYPEISEPIEGCGRNQDFVNQDDLSVHDLEVYFLGNSPICPEELLLYSLMKFSFKTATFTKHHSSSRYEPIVTVVSKICGVQFSASSVRRFFPRISKNEIRSNVGKINGKVRWIYFKEKIETFMHKCATDLGGVLNNPTVIPEHTIVHLNEKLKDICNSQARDFRDIAIDNGFNFARQFNKTVKPHLSKTSPWIPWFDPTTNSIHIYSFGESPGYANKEVRISSAFEWTFFTNKIERQKSNFSKFEKIPNTIENVKSLVDLLRLLDEYSICKGCDGSEQFKVLEKPGTAESVYKTRDGKDAVLKEDKTFRSSNCFFLVPKGSFECQSCKKCRHYMRTLLARKSEQKENVMEKKARLDYKTKPELLEIARESTAKIKVLQTKNKRLEAALEDKVELGPNTNSDLQHIFNDLYIGLEKNKEKRSNPVCSWEHCPSREFENVEELFRHCKGHIERLDTSVVPPINRCYHCKWQGCKKHYSKLKLLENHLREHTGSMNDEFLEILLSDQGKAMSSNPRQMRWHPLVIKWCLRIYIKSHRLYEDLRNSGGLKLPSGRTLSDYKNFNSTDSGWHVENLQNMKRQFDQMKPPLHAKLGALVFDEVKINEGLVFDPQNWELVGFTDLCEDEFAKANGQATTANGKDKLATHVLQFFFRSVFFKFDYPCAFFLTKNLTSLQLNRLFWLGISMLHSFGFEVLVSCCDGASCNRSFVLMNVTNDNKSYCQNPFSGMPLFFFSDPPHLIKKLRNNIHSSGFKEKNRRYTRTLRLDGKYILWDHIYSVYLREIKRHLYVTDMRKAHVEIDRISKMRVKLAVETLSTKVANEMEACENDATEQTRRYIRICEKFWKAFNDPRPLNTVDDGRISELDEVVKYFKDWGAWLAKKFPTKSEQSDHFISWQTKFDLEVRL